MVFVCSWTWREEGGLVFCEKQWGGEDKEYVYSRSEETNEDGWKRKAVCMF